MDSNELTKARGFRFGRSVVVSLVVLSVAIAVGCARNSSAAVGPVAALRPLLLDPAKIGSGYVAARWTQSSPSAGLLNADTPYPGGCGDFPSEKLRVDRIGAEYRSPSAVPIVTDEITSYRRGGAAQAMRELAAIMVFCRSSDVDMSAWGGEVRNSSSRYSLVPTSGAGLLSGAIVVQSGHELTYKNGRVKKSSQIRVFQARGDVLSVVVAQSGTPAAQMTAALAAGRASAGALKRGSG